MLDNSGASENQMTASLSMEVLFCELARTLELAYVSTLLFFLFYPNYCPPLVSVEVLCLARGLGAVFLAAASLAGASFDTAFFSAAFGFAAGLVGAFSST